jgi:hypothetical protein
MTTKQRYIGDSLLLNPDHGPSRPDYVYVASSWQNPLQVAVCAALRSCGIDHYDFNNPIGGTDALHRADTTIVVWPFGKWEYLKLGIAIGRGQRTAIFMEGPTDPELMYLGASFLTDNFLDLLGWLRVED